jgi:hypothetical protein
LQIQQKWAGNAKKFPVFSPTFFVEFISLALALLSDVNYRFAAIFLSGKDADGRRKPNKERNE